VTSLPEPRKAAIITGASQGVGAGIADGLLGIGYCIVATSLSISPSDSADVHTIQGDISQAETAQRIVHETLDRFGRIDTLVNNAGIFIGKPFLDYTCDDFAAMTAVTWIASSTSRSASSATWRSRAADTSSTSPRASSITRASVRRLPSRRSRTEASMP
jgi:NAD(P)-dependent dehydrogenase (short-subunit alcohol dehydrogenase family)